MSSFLCFLRLPYRGHFAVAVGKNDRIPGSGVNYYFCGSFTLNPVIAVEVTVEIQ